MAGIDGIWYCANFLGDSFDLTAFDDGALMIQMVRRRLRPRGNAVRLDPSGAHLHSWEAVNQVRLRLSGNKLLLQEHLHGKWGSEVEAFRDSFAAAGEWFRYLREGKRRKAENEASSKGVIIERVSETVFKVEPCSLERAFKAKALYEPYHLGEVVERRDKGNEWCTGYVTSVNPLKVTSSDEHPQAQGYTWEEVRKKACGVDIALDASATDIECQICMTDKADVVLLPCGHSGLCELCVRKIYSQSGSLSCPFCRQSVAKFAKVQTGAKRIILADHDIQPISLLAGKPRFA